MVKHYITFRQIHTHSKSIGDKFFRYYHNTEWDKKDLTPFLKGYVELNLKSKIMAELKQVYLDLNSIMNAIEKKENKRPTKNEIKERLNVKSLKTLHNWELETPFMFAQLKELSVWSGMPIEEMVKNK